MSERPCLILVPGLMCDAAAWQPVLPGLATHDCRVVQHGQADSLVQMARQVLDQAPARFALAGHSMGGRVALEVMRLAPERVSHLGLFDTGHRPLPPGAAGEDEVRKRMAWLAMARAQGVRAMARDWVQGMMTPTHLQDTALLESVLDMFERQTADQFECQLRALIGRPDASDVLARVRIPTLLLCGAQDQWSPPAQHQAMADLMPLHPGVVAIPDCGHMAMQEQAPAVLHAMRHWLSQAETAC